MTTHVVHPVPQPPVPPQGESWPDSIPGSGAAARIPREVNIASAILEVSQTEAAHLAGARLVRVGVAIGEDCDIDLSSLSSVLKVARQGTDLEGVDICLIPRPRRSLCHKCAHEFSPRRAAQPCPRCGSRHPELLAGDELELAFIEVERG